MEGGTVGEDGGWQGGWGWRVAGWVRMAEFRGWVRATEWVRYVRVTGWMRMTGR